MTDIEMISRSVIENQYNKIDLQQLNQDQKQSLNLFSSSILKDVKRHQKEEEINNETLKTISQKITQNNLILLTADKSDTLVLIEKDTYIQKMDIALQKNNFKKVHKDNRERNERTVQAILRICLKEKVIDYDTYKKIYPSASPPTIIYGKIKIHKPTMDIRPIVNTKMSYFSGLSRWLIQMLDKYTNRKYIIKNSLELKEHLKLIEIKPDYYMVSLDVISMFGSIDLNLVISYILNRYKFDMDKPFKFETENNLDMLNQMLEICTKDITCIFNGVPYTQENGCGMGLNLSPLLSDIQMWIVENKLMNTLGVGRGKNAFIITYRRYVDDLYFIISHKKHANSLLNIANELSLNIKFTMETENDNALNYLDLTIMRSPTNLDFTIHRKETQNTIRINFKSLYNNQIIKNNLRQEINRSYKICTTEKLLMQELKVVENIYISNDYPKNFIKHHINMINKEFTNKMGRTKEQYIEPPKEKQIYIVLETKEYMEIVKRHFALLNRNNSWNCLNKLNLVEKAPNTLKNSLMYINNSETEDFLKKHTLYLYTCKCGSAYVGNTSRSLKIRSLEHTKQKNSQIYIHRHETGHEIDMDNFVVLMHQDDSRKRLIMERHLMDKYNVDLNSDKGTALVMEQI